ncbi:MAG: GNAT family N-acetyltransferase [Burkholderiaceae bacterium]
MPAQPPIRLANPDEAQSIARMSRDWIEHGLGWSWTAARVLQAIGDPSTNVAVLIKGDRLSGFGIMQYLDDDAAHLVLLAVSPVLRHQGMGRQLLLWLEQSAQVAGSTAIRLECRADNTNAIAFYQHLGYRQVGTVLGYYERRVDAVRLLKRHLTRQP